MYQQKEWTVGPLAPPVRAIAVSPDRSLVAASSGNAGGGSVQVRSSKTGALLFSYGGHTTPVLALTFSPTCPQIASADIEGTVQVWSLKMGTPCCYYQGHTGAVYALAWSPDGRYLASGGSDRTVQVWDPQNGRRIFRFDQHTQSVWALAWSDGLLASASAEVVLHWLDCAGSVYGREVLARSTFGEARGMGFSPDQLLALAGPFPHIELWDTGTGKQFDLIPCPGLLTHTIVWLAWSPDPGTMTMLTLEEHAGTQESTLRLWQSECSRTIQRPVLGQFSGISTAVWLDRQTVVAGTWEGMLMARHLK